MICDPRAILFHQVSVPPCSEFVLDVDCCQIAQVSPEWPGCRLNSIQVSSLPLMGITTVVSRGEASGRDDCTCAVGLGFSMGKGRRRSSVDAQPVVTLTFWIRGWQSYNGKVVEKSSGPGADWEIEKACFLSFSL